MERWFEAPCRFSGFVPPAPFTVRGPVPSTAQCVAPTPSGYADVRVLYGWAPEHDLRALGPIEAYTNQPYSYSSPAPTPPPHTTVEQAIDNELAKPESSLLRQWLNYELGSPGERDPVGDGVNVPKPAVAPGEGADVFIQKLDELGLTNVKFKVLSNPDLDPTFSEGAVVRVSPSPGTHVRPGEEVAVTVNRTAWRQNNGECDRHTRQDPGAPPSGDIFSLKDSSRDLIPIKAWRPQMCRSAGEPLTGATAMYGLGMAGTTTATAPTRRPRSTTRSPSQTSPALIASTSSTWV